MLNPSEFIGVFEKTGEIFPKMNYLDQLDYLRRLTLFAEYCDHLNRTYDGRDKRMKELLEKLEEG